jgi:tryptophan-rich sensory protein
MPEYAFQKSGRPGRRRRIDPPDNLPQGQGSPWPALAGFIGLCLLVGLTAAAVNGTSVQGWYLSLNRPPFTPPNWLFGPVWTVLYLMIGTSAWLIWWRGPQGRRQRAALQLWGYQLLINALWSPVFFGMHDPALGLLVILPMVVLVSMTTLAFARLYRPAALLLLPYLAWGGFATYLNIGFWWLNR